MKFLRRLSRRVRVKDDHRATPPAPVESAPAQAMRRVRIENRSNLAGRRRSRLNVIGLVLSVGFVISAGRAVEIAVFNGEADTRFEAAAAEMAPVRRASILDRDGEILAATLDFHTVYADPHYVWDPVEVADQLATVLPDLDRGAPDPRLQSRHRAMCPSPTG
jgi:cell division protein FtsI (penicillin-binding protein 3)